ncbi:DUF7158 domain-containing protein [Dactylosporangium sp. McL0621]|uniref:DUF7158 domain-containing protein n=1 Tax=Dactylosporangium sp. McL0621 TaxID=3415678 RepID=UPI003CEAE420
MIAAWVGDEPITVAQVEERLAGLYSGSAGARLPHPATAEGRNLRRWLVQLMAANAVVSQDFAEPPLVEPPPVEPPALARALRLGGVAAAVVAARPDVYASVTAGVTVADAEVHDYWSRNRDRHSSPFAESRPAVAALLLHEARDRHFTRWLDERCAARVRLMPGFEHPGNPAQPDYTHHH